MLSDETGSGKAVFDTAPTFQSSVTTPVMISAAADPADAGAIRLGNNEVIGWEASPAGTDLTLKMDANNVLTSSAPVNATNGFRIGNAAASGRYLKGDGTNFVQSSGAASGTGSCTSQAVTALNSDAAPSCTTLTSAYVDTTIVTNSNTNTLTNKTLDAEATGNVISQPARVEFVAAGCDNTTAASAFDLPTSGGPSKSCYGTSPHRFGALDFADGAAALTASVRYLLPADWTATGGVDIKYIWFSGSTSTNSVVWTVQTVCVADGGDVLNPTYNAAQTTADTNNATANTRNSASITGITMTGCAAGETLYLKVGRDPTNASDTLAATASLQSVELTIRRQM